MVDNLIKIKAILDILGENYERKNVAYIIESEFPLVSIVLKSPVPLGIKEDSAGGWIIYFKDNTLFDDTWKYETLPEALSRLRTLIADLDFECIPSYILRAFRTMSDIKNMEGSRIYGVTQYTFSCDQELYADGYELFIETDKGCWDIYEHGTMIVETTPESMHEREDMLVKESNCKRTRLAQLLPENGECLIESVDFLTNRKNWYVGFLINLSTGRSFGLYCKNRFFRDCPTELIIDRDESCYLAQDPHVKYVTFLKDNLGAYCFKNGLQVADMGRYKDRHIWLCYRHPNPREAQIAIERVKKGASAGYDIVSSDEMPPVIVKAEELKPYCKKIAKFICDIDNHRIRFNKIYR